jgi:ribosomal protein L11 methyltransferase
VCGSIDSGGGSPAKSGVAPNRNTELRCDVPYRIDIASPASDALELLLEFGALDIELVGDNDVAAILPDGVKPEAVARAFGEARVTISEATARDSGSVWLLRPRAIRIAGILIAPHGVAAGTDDTLQWIDSNAFGSGHHPTTALCIEALQEMLAAEPAGGLLDVGTGTGILALAALKLGVPQAVGIDVDADALTAARQNAQQNGLSERLKLVCGGPDAVQGTWPLVVANILAAPLIEMAPVMVRRLGHGGRLILSGIPVSVEAEVRRVYQHLGVQLLHSKARAGWTVVTARASW